jgi:hypothetical protein
MREATFQNTNLLDKMDILWSKLQKSLFLLRTLPWTTSLCMKSAGTQWKMVSYLKK